MPTLKAGLATTLLGAAAALLIGAAVPATPALADDWPPPCPSEKSLLPADETRENFKPFQCAQMEHSGKKSLNPGESKTWSKTISYGYGTKTHCEHPNDNDVTMVEADSGSSYTATGTNWGTGDHSFGAGVLFTTYPGAVLSSGFNKGCSNDNGAAKEGRITTSIQKVTDSAKLTSGYATGTQDVQQTITAAVSPSSAPGDCLMQGTAPDQTLVPGHGCVLLFLDDKNPDLAAGDKPVALGALSNGTASLRWTPTVTGKHTLTVLYIGDTTACPSDNATCGWSPVPPNTYDTCISPSSDCTTSATAAGALPLRAPFAAPAPARSAAKINPHLTTRTKAAKTPARLALRCPRGSVLMYAETLSRGEAPLAYSRTGVHVRSRGLRRGRRVAIQITCRSHGAGLLVDKRLGLGTPGPDKIDAGKHGARLVFGGPGRDRIRMSSHNAIGNGALGADRIVVAARNDVANGGPGDDRLVAHTAKRTLLFGGPGHDRLRGGSGMTLINAKDGQRDVVQCGNRRNRVLADGRDLLRGPC